MSDVHLRLIQRPPAPTNVRHVYLIGICGTGMGSLAGLFRQRGCRVRGSDKGVYPPMSTQLAELDIEVYEGFDFKNLDPEPDLVVVGNVCTPQNAEARSAQARKLPIMSFPETLERYFLRWHHPIVVAGTHGKTSVTGLIVHLLRRWQPSFLVGGILNNLGTSFGLNDGSHFIVEGDEYDSAFFDKAPKFLHYEPDVAIVTSMELDHTDMYRTTAEYEEAFVEFVHKVSRTLVLWGDNPRVAALGEETDCECVTYGLNASCDVSAADVVHGPDGQRFVLVVHGQRRAELHLPMHGRHNLLNALGACAVAMAERVHPDALSFEGYLGIARRLEVLGTAGGVTVVDDFAHHPTAVGATIQAACERWKDRRIIAIFEPRSNTSRRKIFEKAYMRSFDQAARVLICAPPFRHNDDPNDFMDAKAVVTGIQERGTAAEVFDGADALLHTLERTAQEGDVMLIMSNGSFDGLHRRLLARLAANNHNQP